MTRWVIVMSCITVIFGVVLIDDSFGCKKKYIIYLDIMFYSSYLLCVLNLIFMNNELIEFHHSLFNVEEVNATGIEIPQLTTELGEGYENLKVRVDTLKDTNDELTHALNRERSSKYTEQKAHDVLERKNAFKGYRTYVEACTFRTDDETIRQAALRIKAVIENHGTTIYDLPQDEQTSKFESLMQSLREEPVKTDTETIDSVSLVDRLDATILQCKATFNSKVQGEAIEVKYRPSWTIRKEVVEELKRLFRFINSMSENFDDPVYPKLVKEINMIIEDMTAIARARKTRSENTDEADE